MINKDDIERLKTKLDFIGARYGDPIIISSDDVKSLKRIIAHLDQPYEYGEIIDVAVLENFFTFLTVSYIANHPRGGVIVGFGDGEIKYFPYHRPIKQTVQVTLDKKIVEAAKLYVEHNTVDSEKVSEDDIIQAVAIAQEGEDE